MSIAIIAPNRDTSIWKKGLQEQLPDEKVMDWADVNDFDAVDCVVAWNHPKGIFKETKNLKLICSMGAGVDHIVSDQSIDASILITKIVDDRLAFSMSNYVIMAILNYHRRLDKFRADQQNKSWDQAAQAELDIAVGIMGFGQLGQDAGEKIQKLGFPVYGMSKSKKEHPSIPTFGASEAEDFFKAINVLVCMLPLTPENHGILNRDLFDRLNQGTYLINVARGKHQNETDIIAALDSGQLSGAFLDVFEKEPLPEESPLWHHPKVILTPHNASLTNPQAAIPQIADNYRRLQSGKELMHAIDRSKGY